MSSKGLVAALGTALSLLLLTAPSASALTKETGSGVERANGVWVGKAKCDRGEQVVSGGFAMPIESEAVVNKRKGDRTWIVKGQDTDGPLTVYAYCSRHLSPGSESDRGRISSDPASEEGTAKARCGRGKTAVAGGWKFDETAGNQPVFTSFGGGGRAWKLSAASGDSPRVTVYAYCLRDEGIQARKRTGATIASEGNGDASVKCRRGEELLGGGFKTKPRPDYSNATGPDLFFSDSRRKGSRGWTATAHNYSDVAGRIKLAALCLG
jgi:hypothetical protein